MKLSIKRNLSIIEVWIVNIIFGLCMLVTVYVLFQIFIFSSFKIPSNSMEPGLITGDNILVCKPIVGPRIFNLFATLREEQTEIRRIPGFSSVKRNDVLVFNFPHPKDWSKIEMHIMKYYIKRCVAIPGDSLMIRNGFYQVKGIDAELGNIESQKRVSAKDSSEIPKGVFWGFPYDSEFQWNIKNFGPFYIPGKGDKIEMNRANAVLYRKVIEWEQKETLRITNDTIYLNNQQITMYTFKKNYYFMAGDRVEDSQDSRYWGLLPEEYIVGKAWIIWKSTDNAGNLRWNRFLKKVD